MMKVEELQIKQKEEEEEEEEENCASEKACRPS
jgi:hypothetical protein